MKRSILKDETTARNTWKQSLALVEHSGLQVKTGDHLLKTGNWRHIACWHETGGTKVVETDRVPTALLPALCP